MEPQGHWSIWRCRDDIPEVVVEWLESKVVTGIGLQVALSKGLKRADFKYRSSGNKILGVGRRRSKI